MPLQNRVTPSGEIVVAPWRGRMMGNRGCLHDVHGHLGTARWRTHAWVTCLTCFRGRHRAPMPPRRYTALFFTDEATALAAGHRPCGECRHTDYVRFREAWLAAWPEDRTLRERDRRLHLARVRRDRSQVRVPARIGDLPDGVFVASPAAPAKALLVWRGALHPWMDGTYMPPEPLDPGQDALLITPVPTAAALAAGYVPRVNISI